MYSRCCFSTPGLDVLLDALPHLHERQPLALKFEGELESLADVDRLEQLHLLLEREVRRVAGRVGERAGLADRADERRDTTVVAPAARGSPRRRRGTRARARGCCRPRARRSGRSSTSTKSRPCESDAAAPATPRCRPSRATARPPPGRRIRSVTCGDGPDLRVLVVVLGHEQHAILVADVDGEGDVHVGEDDDVFQRDEQKACGVLVLAHDALFRTDAIVRSETVPTRARALPAAFSPFDTPQTLQRQRGDSAREAIG